MSAPSCCIHTSFLYLDSCRGHTHACFLYRTPFWQDEVMGKSNQIMQASGFPLSCKLGQDSIVAGRCHGQKQPDHAGFWIPPVMKARTGLHCGRTMSWAKATRSCRLLDSSCHESQDRTPLWQDEVMGKSNQVMQASGFLLS
jgi:hypothetical protein